MKKVLIVFLCLFSLPAIAWEKAVPKLADDYYLDYTNIYFYQNRYIFYWTKSPSTNNENENVLFQIISDCKNNKWFVNNMMITDDQNNILLFGGTNLNDIKDLKNASFKEIGENNILGKVLHNSLCTYYSNKGVIK